MFWLQFIGFFVGIIISIITICVTHSKCYKKIDEWKKGSKIDRKIEIHYFDIGKVMIFILTIGAQILTILTIIIWVIKNTIIKIKINDNELNIDYLLSIPVLVLFLYSIIMICKNYTNQCINNCDNQIEKEELISNSEEEIQL